MNIRFPLNVEQQIREMAKQQGTTNYEIVMDLVTRGVSGITPSPSSLFRGGVRQLIPCLCPSCGQLAVSRGLCRRHYQRVRYYIQDGRLTEAWAVVNGRMAPSPSRTVDDYKRLVVGTPGILPDQSQDTLWLFGRG